MASAAGRALGDLGRRLEDGGGALDDTVGGQIEIDAVSTRENGGAPPDREDGAAAK